MCLQKNTMKIFIILFVAVLCTVRCEEYFGVPLGDLKNSTFGISGKAYLVNSTTIQILNFNLKEVPKLHARFAVSSEHQVGMIEEMFEVENGKNNFKFLKPAEPTNMTIYKDANIILRIPKSSNKEKWKFFGVVSEQKWAYLAAASLDNKIVPSPFCCLPPLNGWIYSVKSNPIQVLDVKTLKIPKFSFDGNKPPDGWFFVGNGAVDKRNGEKCTIRGRDTKGLQCPMREPYKEKDLIIELPGNLTLHDVSWLSVYCYEVGVDFGHIEFKIPRGSQPLPPVLPLLREEDSKVLRGWPTVKLVAVPEPGQKLTDLTFAMGPSGGARAKVFRGTCENLEKVWYVQGMMQPEVWLIRGATYRFKIFGGQSDPLYLTSEKTGGWSQKSDEDKKNITIFAGADGSAAGDSCHYQPVEDRRAKDADSFEDFDEYSHFLTYDCPNRQRPFELTWVADAGKVNDLYYESYNQFYLGGKIRICDKIEDSATTQPKCIRFKNSRKIVLL